ncbi:MAG: pilin [Patescibacteria group bacterium]|nr:pilin [Patescibacteria group bacterium]
MKKYITIILAIIIVLAPIPVLAFQLIPSGCTGQNVTTQNCGLTEIFQTFINFANFLLSIAGSVTLLMFIYGGFVWLTSGGASDKIKKGKDIMVNTTIGLVIMLAAATVIYSVGTFLCGGDQSCLRQLNIYGAAEGQEGGMDCRKQENDGKTCGTEKNYVCSYEARKCVTRCEADQNLASRGYACQTVPLASKDKASASLYAESYSCKLNLCPGDWDTLCCPAHEAATTCCKCEINDASATTYYFPSDSGADCITACESARDLIGATTIPEITPGIERTEDPGCEEALSRRGI